MTDNHYKMVARDQAKELHRIRRENQQLRAERDRARKWAAAWKRGAKFERWSGRVRMSAMEKEGRAENKRYREALTQIATVQDRTPNSYQGELEAWRIATTALKGTADA